MAIFLDSSDLNEIRQFMATGIISGITTNPLIISKENPGVDLRAHMLEIMSMGKVPTSVELTSETEVEMLAEAREYRKWHPQHVVIKVPMTEIGLRIINTLERQDKTPVNVTCIMSFNQAYLSALAGATYVSIFSGRVRDMGYEPAKVIEQTRAVLDREKLKAQIIVGSIRHMADVNEALYAGAHIVTVPPGILRKMCWNPRTTETIREFNDAWKKDRAGGK
ncbi:MAG TPA: transaldolase family protein [Myxococcales bacterium]|jgi:transaldolase|nr:transaldolase family protein [Myxococcales bacterium]